MTVDDLLPLAERAGNTALEWAQSPQFYAQVAAIAIAVAAASFVARELRHRLPFFRLDPAPGPFLRVRQVIYASRDLLFAVLSVLTLALAVQASDTSVGTSWLVRFAESFAVVAVLYTAIRRYITNPLVRGAAIYVAIPVAALKVFGLLDQAVAWLDALSFEAGNVRISVYAIVKAAIFGSILFWLGRISTDAGQSAIRKQDALEPPTRELFAKLFQIAVFSVAFLLLLQLMGLDLTALAVFGGALGVGIGFGLQQIAANFISGIIILVERSLKLGDYIELEDGKAGILKELNMRSSTLATFDGREIMVPNEKLITTSFSNWTKSDPLQQYEVVFHVPNDADLEHIAGIAANAAAMVPGVSGSPERPAAEIKEFGESTTRMAVSFWVSGIEGGPGKVPAAVRMGVWKALRAAGVSLPSPLPR
jgi:small-conductance mechanosensitive channel